MEEGTYTDLLTLQESIREGLEDLFPDKLWIKAEVSSIQVKANGHCYMDLCQSGDTANRTAIVNLCPHGSVDLYCSAKRSAVLSPELFHSKYSVRAKQ